MYQEVFQEQEGQLKFVGDFDRLYSNHADPWGQSGEGNDPVSEYYRASRCRLINLLRHEMTQWSYKGLEVGCGHGHVTDMLSRAMPASRWMGLDISRVAIEQARMRYPRLPFAAGSICVPYLPQFLSPHWCDVIVLNQCLWYVIDNMSKAVDNCVMLLKPNGLLIISQAFLRENQRYATDIANGFFGTQDMLRQRFQQFRLTAMNYADDPKHAHIDGLFAMRLK